MSIHFLKLLIVKIMSQKNLMNKFKIIFFILIVACKTEPKESKITENTQVNTVNNVTLKDENFEEGDKLISNIEFIKTIDETCKRTHGVIQDNKKQRDAFNDQCQFYNIKYNYEVYRVLEKQKQLYQKDDINYYFDLAIKNSESDDYKFVNLYASKNGRKIDSLEVYNYENFIEALVEKGKYFYIKDEKIFTYMFYEDEDGIHNSKLNEYEIKKGNFELVKSHSFE